MTELRAQTPPALARGALNEDCAPRGNHNPISELLEIHVEELPGFPDMNGPSRAIRSIAIRDSVAGPSSLKIGRQPNVFKASRVLGKEI